MRIYLIKGREYVGRFDVYKNQNGKPFLRNSKKFISVTHFDKWTLVVTRKKPIGVDVERMRRVDARLRSYLGVKNGGRYGFFKEWTRREAYIKKHDLKLGSIKTKKEGKFRTFLLYPYVISFCF